MAARVPPAWIVGPLLAVRNAVGRLHRVIVPPEVVLVERTLGIVDTKAIAVAAELGVADLLTEGPRRADDLATATGSDADALARLLRYLVGRGVFAATRDGRFANNRVSERLRTGTDTSMRSWARFFGARWHVDGWNHLDHAVASGEAGFVHATGSTFWDHLREDPAAGRCFADAMAEASRLQVDLVAAAHDFTSCRTVCDVGGGTGTVLAGILAENPHLRGVLVDLPEVVAGAPAVLAGRGVADRVDVVGGDFFASVPEGCDRYVLQAVVHDWDDDSVVQILERVRDAAAPGARVLVLEQPVPPGSGEHLVKAFDLEMLVDTGAGRERTVEEYRALFLRAGLRTVRITPVSISTLFELVAQE